jgi:hypothetical protein
MGSPFKAQENTGMTLLDEDDESLLEEELDDDSSAIEVEAAKQLAEQAGQYGRRPAT